MLQVTTSRDEASDRAEAPAVAIDEVVRLRRRLAAMGLGARVHRIGAHLRAAGVAVPVSVADALSGEEPDAYQALERQLHDAREVLRSGMPVTLQFLDADNVGRAAIQTLCDRLNRIFRADCIASRQLGVAAAASTFSPHNFDSISNINAIARDSLGAGPRYLILDLDARKDGVWADRLWQSLHKLYAHAAPPWLAVAAGVQSYCPLLSSESGDGLLPGTGIAAPPASAWLPIDLDLSRFVDTAGNISEAALDATLDACIELGDALFDRLSWFDERQRHDARMNRRLAIMLSGIGDLVTLKRRDPADIACLRDIDSLVARIHDGLWQRSRRLAEQRGPLPALAERQPDGDWRCDAHRQDWQLRWRRALETAQVRHRNLLVMSPYCVLPRACKATPAYADLLPVIAHADALSFAEPPSLVHWNLNDFKSFHQRVLALVERQNAASFIAGGV